MVKQAGKIAAAGMVWLGLVAGIAQTAAAEPISAVPQLDLNRLTGTWYEIALYQNKWEKRCTSDATLLYALGDKPHSFQLVNACKIKNGNTDARNATGKRADKGTDGKLKVTYTFPFTSKHWVLAIGPDYEWGLVGSPNHKALWILSRTPALKPEVLAEIEAKAVAEGFNASKIVMMPQRIR